jgi:photosystem II stability/assembly factor-like uncharacterized protein
MIRTALSCLALALLGALACAAPSLAAGVQVGSSGWLWGNPLPQGNSVNALSFAGASGYAVGDFGTLLATTDGGTTWAGLSSGTFTNLRIVQAIDGDSVFAGGGCVGRRSDDGGKTFKRVAFTPVESRCTQGLASAWFVSESLGYLVLADGTVLRTDNNGETFAQRIAVPGTRATGGTLSVPELRFLDANVGFATTSDGKIYRTADGANSWTVVSDTQRSVNDILFLDATKGIAVGDGSLFLTTSDAGLTWKAKALTIASPQPLKSISCATGELCVMATAGNQIVRTTDGGATGSLIAPAQDPVSAAAFASPTRVAALGRNGATAISDDAGATFIQTGGRLSGRYFSVIAGPPNVAFAPGDNGSLAKTTDGGKTWSRGNVSTSEDVLDVSFATPSDGYALDIAGGLFRSRDGGSTWRALDTGTTAAGQAVLAVDRNLALVVGPRGLRRSVDAGESFSAVSGAVNSSSLSGIDRAGSTLFAYGFRDVWRSTDKGRTWKAVRKPGKATRQRNGRLVNTKRVARVDFVSASTGWLLDSDGGRLYRTTDGGRRWTLQDGVGTHSAYGMAMSTDKNGYLVIPRFGTGDVAGYLLRTTDGGITWAPEFVVSSRIASRGVAAGQGTDYLLGGDSSLLSSATGGLAGEPSSLSITTRQRIFKKTPKGTITITGTLSPTKGGDQVTVSYRRGASSRWSSQTVKVAANGNFTTSWRIAKGSNLFVAQWLGNFASQGRGSAALNVRVGSK